MRHRPTLTNVTITALTGEQVAALPTGRDGHCVGLRCPFVPRYTTAYHADGTPRSGLMCYSHAQDLSARAGLGLDPDQPRRPAAAATP